MKYECVICGKTDLDKDTVGINKKLLGEQIQNFYCMDCLAEYLECTVEELLDKIEEFKSRGLQTFYVEVSMKKIVYADNAATTKLDIDAFEAMKPFLLEEYGNPSQPYAFSRIPKKAIKESREIIAECIGLLRKKSSLLQAALKVITGR